VGDAPEDRRFCWASAVSLTRRPPDRAKPTDAVPATSVPWARRESAPSASRETAAGFAPFSLASIGPRKPRPARGAGMVAPRGPSHGLPGASRGAPAHFLKALPASLGAEEVGVALVENPGRLGCVLHFHSTHGVPDSRLFALCLLDWRFLRDSVILVDSGSRPVPSVRNLGPARSGPRRDRSIAVFADALTPSGGRVSTSRCRTANRASSPR